MMASPRNRIRFDVDNPIDGDGFYRFVQFKTGNRARKGGRIRRRAIWARENRAWKREGR